MSYLSGETKRLFRLLPKQELFASGNNVYENGRAMTFEAHYVAEKRFIRLDVSMYEVGSKNIINVVDFIETNNLEQAELTILCSDRVKEIEDKTTEQEKRKKIGPVALRLVKK